MMKKDLNNRSLDEFFVDMAKKEKVKESPQEGPTQTSLKSSSTKRGK